MLSFDNTADAFAYKADRELKRARFLFSAMGNKTLLSLGLALTPPLVKWNIPFVKPLLKQTIFKQFVGGETLAETKIVAEKLGQYGVKVILDYGVEGGNDGEKGFDASTNEFISVINYASGEKNIPFMSIKLTGLSRFSLLEHIHFLMQRAEGTLLEQYATALQKLNDTEKSEWERVVDRIERICNVAAVNNIGVLIDAEETWIQGPVDALTMLMMQRMNKGKAIVYNTIQLYRHDRLDFLLYSIMLARQNDFILGAKLVRGAYMEKERARAVEKNYPSPIQPDKASCDADYNEAVALCINNLDCTAVIIASHNEHSNLYAAQLLKDKSMSLSHPHVHFSQLYGMSDNITFNLAKSGCSVSKYLPFGPLKDVIPYLMRRAQENSSVSGQTGRELSLIEHELKRRKSI